MERECRQRLEGNWIAAPNATIVSYGAHLLEDENPIFLRRAWRLAVETFGGFKKLTFASRVHIQPNFPLLQRPFLFI